MKNKTAIKWNHTYQVNAQEIEACRVLREYGYLLPQEGFALDLACGLAGNAFYMAERGLTVDAIDISEVAIDKVNNHSERLKLDIMGIVRDVETKGLDERQYDVIVVSHFLSRSLMPEIIQHLKTDGILFYQTWVKEKVEGIGPRNEDFLLEKGELLHFCKDMDILHYHEEGLMGDTSKGIRNQAEIIAVR